MKRLATTLCMLCVLMVAWAQNLTVNGVVTSKADGEPLIGATVMVKGSSTGTATDIDGNYTLANVPSNATLVFSYVGYNPQEIKVAGRRTVNAILDEGADSLDEVVVIGYGVVKRSDLTSSISTVKGDQISEVTVGNAMDALQGKVGGVQIATSGKPGASPKVMIRGITSVNGSNPLYVVDGVPLNTDNINFLNNDDIESMEILKDASASAIYGTRASNGVIIITTKKGKAGKVAVDVSASVGWQNISKPDMAGAGEYEKVFKARYENDGRTAPWNSPKNDYTDGEGTDWWDATINRTALIQNYSLGVRGGNEKFLYSFSAGYFNNHSQFDFGKWDKLNIRLNTEYNFSKVLKAGLDISPTMENWSDSPENFGNVLSMDPTTPVFKPEDQWDSANPMNNYQRSYNNESWNPVAEIARMDNHSRKMQALVNAYVQIQPIEQLVLRTQFGANAWYERKDWYDCKFHIDALEQRQENKVGRDYKDGLNWTWNNTITYMDTFADRHNLTAMAGFTAERYADWKLSGSRTDVPGTSDLLHELDAATGTQSSSGTSSYQTLASFLGRIMYNFDQRYFLTASVRADGSSRFPKGNKFGVFPSVSAAWRLTNESFMEPTRDWLSDAKIRLGWGQVGNQAIRNGAYMTRLNNGVNYVFGNEPVRTPGTIVGSIGNPNLKWETVEDIDFGVDLLFLDSRLGVTFDWFQKTSHDMLYDKQGLLFLGNPAWLGAVTQNIGEMRARGWELGLTWRDQAGDFHYNIGVQLSAVKNKAIKFTGDGPIKVGDGLNESIIWNVDGGLISRFFGYRTAGIFQNWEQVYAHTDEHGTLIQPDAKPGDIIFRDLNHDGKLTDDDKRWIGNPYPDLTLGLNMGFEYKGFDLTANFYGTFGNDIFNLQRQRYSGAGGQNVYGGTFDEAWHGEGTSNDIPRLSYSDLNQNYSRVSDFFVEDGSYFRCKLLTLGYTLPRSVTKETSLRFYVSFQNLFTITGYSGWDPETPFYNGGVIETGIDNSKYPTPRTYLVGLDFKF